MLNGRFFFIDYNIKIIIWEDLRLKILVYLRGKILFDIFSDLGFLFFGWEERIYIDGRIFYINYNIKRI